VNQRWNSSKKDGTGPIPKGATLNDAFLGRGWFGCTFRAKLNKNDVAIKIIDNDETKIRIKPEILELKQDNIARVHCSGQVYMKSPDGKTSSHAAIILDLVKDAEELKNFQNFDDLEPKTRISLFMQVLDALCGMWDKGLMHEDLVKVRGYKYELHNATLNNIMYNKDTDSIHIIDLEDAQRVKDITRYDPQSDFRALEVLAWKLKLGSDDGISRVKEILTSHHKKYKEVFEDDEYDLLEGWTEVYDSDSGEWYTHCSEKSCKDCGGEGTDTIPSTLPNKIKTILNSATKKIREVINEKDLSGCKLPFLRSKPRRRMAQRTYSNRRDSPVMLRLLAEIYRANEKAGRF